ncbi:hypothetical protein TRVA0_013S02212 [Trichomonascus vanleenenianus]|uniref:rhomboid family protein n=1 Tax=Trichomonascus vanleenenianus TaxID=2268995 RepID=UPI003EC96243
MNDRPHHQYFINQSPELVPQTPKGARGDGGGFYNPSYGNLSGSNNTLSSYNNNSGGYQSGGGILQGGPRLSDEEADPHQRLTTEREPQYYNDYYYSEMGEPSRPKRSRKGLDGAKIFGRRIRWKKLPYFCIIISIIQIAVFIAELVKAGVLTGTPIQIKPSFNPMVGPSSYVMINMGARFTPCMHAIDGVTNDATLKFPCPNSTDTSTNVCSLRELCGMGGMNMPETPGDGKPNQWWRFITPIFLHAGFVHIGFNLLLQLKLGADLERSIGIVRFVIVYLSSGIAGFVLGGNFTPDGIASTGASGSLFGVIAIDLLDLLFNWQMYVNPVRNLIFHILEIIVSFAIGLLPGLDNFSHIGGFAMGVLVGTAILRSPLKLRLRETGNETVGGPSSNGMEKAERLRVATFHWRQPGRHFAGRSKWWYAWFVVRLAAVVLAVVYFVMLIRNFEHGGGNCSWCKYLSCLPVKGWCDLGNLTTDSQNQKRFLRDL